ncbi:MAG: hypothetical protein K6F59_02960 [Gammaproteobacteria bacterium]|nr:hypothetical protein [Gammaproteobacteria bacterium]
MENILNKIKENSLIIIMACLFGAAGFTFITGCASFPSKFFPVIGHLLSLVLSLALLVSIPLFLILKNEKLAKYATFIYGGYWLINRIFSSFNSTILIQKEAGSGNIARGIFLFIIGLCLIGAIVLFVLGKIKNEHQFIMLALIVLCGTVGLFFIEFILDMIMCITNKLTWISYFDAIASDLLVPIGLLAATIRLSWVTKEESIEVIDVE